MSSHAMLSRISQDGLGSEALGPPPTPVTEQSELMSRYISKESRLYAWVRENNSACHSYILIGMRADPVMTSKESWDGNRRVSMTYLPCSIRVATEKIGVETTLL